MTPEQFTALTEKAQGKVGLKDNVTAAEETKPFKTFSQSTPADFNIAGMGAWGHYSVNAKDIKKKVSGDVGEPDLFCT